jgi:hypothetical protein
MWTKLSFTAAALTALLTLSSCSNDDSSPGGTASNPDSQGIVGANGSDQPAGDSAAEAGSGRPAQSFPSELVGDWSGGSQYIGTDYSFDASGRVILTIAQNNGSSLTCTGTAQANSSTITFQFDPASKCQDQNQQWRLDGLTLHLGEGALTKEGVALDSAECLLGTWALTSYEINASVSAWGIRSDDTVEIWSHEQDDLGELVLRADGTGTQVADTVLQDRYDGMELALHMKDNYAFHYTVSGDTILYSGVTGSSTNELLVNGRVIRTSQHTGADYTPDNFTCTMPAAKVFGDGYQLSYRRE